MAGPLAGGTFAGLAGRRVSMRPLRDVYADRPGVDPDDQVVVDPDAALVLLDAFARGDAAMRAFAPDQQPVLWPEHFDVGIALAKVNCGVSPSDAHVPEPYTHVGPWTCRPADRHLTQAASGVAWAGAIGACCGP